jgi:hypothetical protein
MKQKQKKESFSVHKTHIKAHKKKRERKTQTFGKGGEKALSEEASSANIFLKRFCTTIIFK